MSGYRERQALGASLCLEADRFCSCGSQFQLWDCPTDRVRFRSPLSCNSRICDRCGRRYFRSYQDGIYQELAPLFSEPRRGWGVFLLTLTTNSARYTGLPTRADIRRFYQETGKFFRLTYGKHYARLTKKGQIIEDTRRHEWHRDDHGNRVRQRRTPKTRQGRQGRTVQDWRRFKGCGYITTIELGSQPTNKGGLNNNLHCHAIVYGPYISQRELANRWFSITGDSYVVDIRKVNNPKAATSYVLKYITKPPAVRTPTVLADYVETIKGTRRLRTGGIFFDKMKRRRIDRLPFQCPFCAGRLDNAGQATIDDLEKHDSHPLYPLLKQQLKAPPPDIVRRQGAADEIAARAAAWDAEHLNYAHNPLSIADLQSIAD